MDALIRCVGLVLRAPVAAVGAFFVSMWTAVVITGLLWLQCFAVPIAWLLVGVPAAFFGVSFRGSGSEQLKQTLAGHMDAWRRRNLAWWSSVEGGWMGLWNWFVTGSSEHA